jgi:cobalt/nickel transport system permease protein
MPRVMVMLLSFMYRYIFVLTDEAMRLKRARDSRNFGGSNWWQIKTVGRMISTLFLRSYERGERVYVAMLARGYDGHSRTAESSLSYRQRDAYYGVGAGLVIISAGLLGFVI